jgi:hypothetical protein
MTGCAYFSSWSKRPALASVRMAICFAVLFSPLFFCRPADPQTTAGRILGSVHDSQDAAVVGAKVTVTDTLRGMNRTIASDEAGDFVVPDLPPSTYTLHIEAKGFTSFERKDIALEVARDVRIDAILKAGLSTEVVTITGELPMLDSTDSTLGGTLSHKEINELPLNGRNYENLLQLRPGVMRYPGGGFSTTSTNGLRAEDNAYMVDGLFNSEPFSGQSIINGAGIAGDSATILPLDAIQEFNVEENPPAEYGWKPGAIVNVGIRSGTNRIHGDAYAFGRTTSLDARNYFNAVPNPKTPRQLEQFGGTIGGPIRKDKLFYFAAYEGQKYTVGNSYGVLPSPATTVLPDAGNCNFGVVGDCAGSVPNAIADLQAGGIPISQSSLNASGCTLGPPVSCNGKGFQLNSTGSVVSGFPNNVTVNNAVGKINYFANQKNTISGFYFYGNNSGTVQDFPNEFQSFWLTLIHTRAQVFGVSWVWVPSPDWTNELRFGYNRLYQPTYTVDHTVPATAYGLNTGVTNPFFYGMPRIKLGGYGPQVLGGFNWPKVQGPDQRFQFIDHVSYTEGKHAFKFGGEVHRDSFSGGAYAGGRGLIKFGTGFDAFPGATPLEDFYAGVPTSATVLVGNPTRYIHNWGIGLFIQDDWRITRRLTLNLGLRYELNTVIKADSNLLGNFDPKIGLVQVGQQISGPYNGDHNNFAPRAGLAWDVFGTGKTIVRAGGGIIYETVNWEAFLAFNNTLGLPTVPTGAVGVVPGGGNIAVANVTFFNNPPQGTLNWDPGPLFPSATSGLINCAANPCTIMGVQQNLETPYISSWTLNVQQAITNNISLQVAYVGNHGTKLTGIHDINQPTEGAGWAACIASNYTNASACAAADPAAEQAARPYNAIYPFLAQIYQMGNIYGSNYNALQITGTARNYHGLSFVAGYTFSHGLDNVGANWDFGYGLGLPQNSLHATRDYASSDFDMRNRFTLSVTYAVPGIKSWGQLLEGWQINSIFSVYGSQPWGPIDQGTDVSGTGEFVDRWNFFGGTSSFKSNQNPIPYFGGASNAACAAKALALDGGVAGGNTAALNLFGCYAQNQAMMLPPALGHFGVMSRNYFRDHGFRDWDFSVFKNFKVGERLAIQLRFEFFNLLNHPNFANPYGGQNGYGQNDPSAPGVQASAGSPAVSGFGCGCATPDVAAANPIIGSGSSRAVQLGLKLTF